jgi:predicted ArsR family transcriptional regulator
VSVRTRMLETTEPRAAQVLALVARAGAITIAELVRAMGVTTTAVRQQVNRLQWDGWLVREQRRGGTGRPADVFSLSEQAKRAFGTQVDEFARLLIADIAESEGPEKLRQMLRRVSRRLARGMESAAGDGPPAERVARLTQSLQQAGTVAALEATGTGVRLSVHTCPFHGLGEARRQICEVERQTLGRLAGGSARLTHSLAGGDACCAFELGAQAAGAATK